MTRKNKDLLLKDLCARLPYEVIINVHDTFPCTTLPYFNIHSTSFVSIISFIEPIFKTKDKLIKRILKEHTEYLEFKPYLHPIYKLTKEELEELEFLTDSDYVDYCNKHHIDYRNLIPKSLALEAPEGMYNIKEK